jgi:hypothetical protein
MPFQHSSRHAADPRAMPPSGCRRSDCHHYRVNVSYAGPDGATSRSPLPPFRSPSRRSRRRRRGHSPRARKRTGPPPAAESRPSSTRRPVATSVPSAPAPAAEDEEGRASEHLRHRPAACRPRVGCAARALPRRQRRRVYETKRNMTGGGDIRRIGLIPTSVGRRPTTIRPSACSAHRLRVSRARGSVPSAPSSRPSSTNVRCPTAAGGRRRLQELLERQHVGHLTQPDVVHRRPLTDQLRDRGALTDSHPALSLHSPSSSTATSPPGRPRRRRPAGQTTRGAPGRARTSDDWSHPGRGLVRDGARRRHTRVTPTVPHRSPGCRDPFRGWLPHADVSGAPGGPVMNLTREDAGRRPTSGDSVRSPCAGSGWCPRRSG